MIKLSGNSGGADRVFRQRKGGYVMSSSQENAQTKVVLKRKGVKHQGHTYCGQPGEGRQENGGRRCFGAWTSKKGEQKVQKTLGDSPPELKGKLIKQGSNKKKGKGNGWPQVW